MYRPALLLPLLLLLLHIHTVFSSIFDRVQGHCGPIEIELCKDIPYNYTYHPNPFIQEQSGSSDHFRPLIKTRCHRNLQFFICSVFAPMCPNVPDVPPQAVPSCRSVCEQVKKDCMQILAEFSIEWPEALNCSRFPEPPSLCMNPPPDEHSELESPLPPPVFSQQPSTGECPSFLVSLDPGDPQGLCAFPCETPTMFSMEQKERARTWSVTLAIAALVLNAFTFLTFLIDTGRFRFPERSVFFLSLCYVFHALPYAASLIFTWKERACDSQPPLSFLVQSGAQGNNVCVASFFLSYYFSLASSLWWLLFTFTWYLAAARKWVPEGIAAYSPYLHVSAWGLPALLCVLALVTHMVDASELTGVCGVGNSHPTALLVFSLAPRLVFVFLGAIFLVAGLASMCKERTSFRLKGTDTSRLEKLMLKMGLFCALYIIPAVTLVVCEGYEYFILRDWHPRTLACRQNGGVEGGRCEKPANPQWEVYLLKLVMSLAVGVSTAMWIFSTKTLHSWQNFLLCRCSQPPQKTPPAAIPLLSQPAAPLHGPPQPPSAHYIPSSHWRTGMQL